MATKSTRFTRIVLWLLVVAVLLMSCCCCGSGIALMFSPQLAISQIVDDHPLPGGVPGNAASPETRAALREDLRTDGKIAWSPEELLAAMPPPGSTVETLTMAIDGQDRLALDLSLRLDPQTDQYVNVHYLGGFRMEHGWFTHLDCDELLVGGWELGGYLTGQELAQHANRSLADQRVQHPETGAALDGVELATIEGGKVVLELTPTVVEQLLD